MSYNRDRDREREHQRDPRDDRDRFDRDRADREREGRRTYDREVVPTLRVAGSSDSKNMATAIERRVLDFRAVKLEAIGAASVNQAAKSIAIARGHLEVEGKSLAVYPEFIHILAKEAGQGERSAIQYFVFATPPRKTRSRRYDEEDDARILRVSQKSDAKTVATSIQTRMRLDGTVKVQAVGAGSVNQAVKAIAIARRGLDDTLHTDLVCYPEFIHIPAPTPGEGERSALRWTLFSLSSLRRERERDYYYERDYDRDYDRDYERDYYERDRDRDRERDRERGYDRERAYDRERVRDRDYDRDWDRERDRARDRDRDRERDRDRDWDRDRDRDYDRERDYERERPRPVREERRQEKLDVPLHDPPYRSDTGEDKVQELKVAATSDAKAVAGAVSLRLRSGDPVRITVMGPSSINQMVKALAVARTYLEEDHADMAVYAHFIHLKSSDESEQDRSALQITLYLTHMHKVSDSDATEFKVAGSTNPKSTAGAIANSIRGSKPCKLEALGPKAVGQAIKAIAIGRANLEQDHTDIFFVPQFRTMMLSNGRRSALELLVLPVKKKS